MLDRIYRLAHQVSDIFELQNLNEVTTKVLILLLSFLAPLAKMLGSLLFLILIDLITGVLAAVKKKQKLRSSKLSRTISKLLVYFVTIFVVHIANEYLLFGPDFVPLESFVVGFIALTELKSIFENLHRITNQNFLKVLIHKLSNEGRKKEEK